MFGHQRDVVKTLIGEHKGILTDSRVKPGRKSKDKTFAPRKQRDTQGKIDFRERGPQRYPGNTILSNFLCSANPERLRCLRRFLPGNLIPCFVFRALIFLLERQVRNIDTLPWMKPPVSGGPNRSHLSFVFLRGSVLPCPKFLFSCANSGHWPDSCGKIRTSVSSIFLLERES